MTGVRGPVPKRSTQRRRTNAPEIPVESVPPAPVADEGEPWKVPLARGEWHEIAKDWFHALKKSGQAGWFQPSDWMEAYVAAQVLSEMLNAGKISAMLYASWSSHTSRLLVTEGDRRRVRIELERGEKADPDRDAGVAATNEWHLRLAGAAK
jgi:hypothetical protein